MARRNNQLTSQELSKITHDSLTYEESVELFVQDCKVRNLREDTIEFYAKELKLYEKYLREPGSFPDTFRGHSSCD